MSKQQNTPTSENEKANTFAFYYLMAVLAIAILLAILSPFLS